MIKLLAFLGNPGTEYKRTRHNAGFMLSDVLYPNMQYQSKFHSLYASQDNRKIIKPLTYMNLSGTAVSEAASFFRFKPDEIMVIHDDLELPLGKAKIQKGGSLQGHNGLRSIKERLGTDQFYRLRIGIGRPKHNDVSLFVTSPFSYDEQIEIDRLFQKIASSFSDLEKERIIE